MKLLFMQTSPFETFQITDTYHIHCHRRWWISAMHIRWLLLGWLHSSRRVDELKEYSHHSCCSGWDHSHFLGSQRLSAEWRGVGYAWHLPKTGGTQLMCNQWSWLGPRCPGSWVHRLQESTAMPRSVGFVWVPLSEKEWFAELSKCTFFYMRDVWKESLWSAAGIQFKSSASVISVVLCKLLLPWLHYS